MKSKRTFMFEEKTMLPATSLAPVVRYRWASYAIDRVQYHSDPTFIEAVRLREVFADGMVAAISTPVTRKWVVEKIEAGLVFKTVTGPDAVTGVWTIGALVLIELVRGVKYLRTVRDGTPTDNLGNLPSF